MRVKFLAQGKQRENFDVGSNSQLTDYKSVPLSSAPLCLDSKDQSE